MRSRGLVAVRWLVGMALMALGGFLVYQPFHHASALERYAGQLRATGVEVPTTVQWQQTGTDRHGNPIYEPFLWYHTGDEDSPHLEPYACDVCPRAGSTVRIWVNPDDPLDFVDENGTLSGDRNRSQALIGFLGLGTVFLGFAIIVVPVPPRWRGGAPGTEPDPEPDEDDLDEPDLDEPAPMRAPPRRTRPFTPSPNRPFTYKRWI
jgi:uncharacterized protein DUF3592